MYKLLFLLFISSGLFNLSSGVATQQLQQQCECDGVSPVVGTSVPVFTAYNDNCKLDPSKVPPYAALLENAGINGVTLLAPQVGSLYLTLAEKKQVIKTWCDVKKSTGFPYTVTCHVGETNYNNTRDLAKFAKGSCCDIVIAGPPLYYPSADVAGLVDYLKGIADAVYPTPFMYADLLYPDGSFVYNTAKLFAKCVKKIENFVGVKSDFETCLKIQATSDVSNKILVSESALNIPGAYNPFCLNGSSTILANIVPKFIVDIQQATFNNDADTAISLQLKINRLYLRVLDVINRPERIDRSELGYIIQVDRVFFKIVNGIDLGVLPSPPFPKLSRNTILAVYKVCQEEGFAKRYPYDTNQYPSVNRNKGKQTYPENDKGASGVNTNDDNWE